MSRDATVTLRDGGTLPGIGFGTYPLREAEGVAAVSSALEAGYRLLDTAVNYRNEGAVGEAVAASTVPRDEIVVTTKLPGRHHGFDATLASFAESRRALGLETIDLYLIHWPNPSVDRYVDSWRAMIELRDRGELRHIGVSNFTIEFLQRLERETGELPSVNQVELHPFFPQTELLAFHGDHGILTEAWSPLGKNAPVLASAPVQDAAAAHGVTPAQAVLRWHQQRGVLPIPKSADPARQRENLALDVDLTEDEVAAITALGRPDGRLFGGDPRTHEEQ